MPYIDYIVNRSVNFITFYVIPANVYIKVSLMSSENVIKSRKTKSQRKKAHPIFNEEVMFNLTPANIDRLSLNVSLYMRTTMGKSRLVSKTVAGPVIHATGQGLEHWKEMMTCPRSIISKWHVLI